MKRIIAVLIIVSLLIGILGGFAYAQSPDDSVYVNFGTNYGYDVPGDNFTNGEVVGKKNWGSYMDRKGATSPATDVTLTLDSILTFDWINPEPYSMGPPIEWHFGDVAPETGVNAGVGPGSPVSFTPGFDASRSADATHFTSAGTQTLTITVTPQQELPNLNIDVNVQEDAYVTPNIVSPTTDETQGIWLWEGKKLHIQIPNPQIPNPVEGTPYTYEVVIEVVPKVPEIEFMPDVGIGWGEKTTSGNASGASLTHAIAELGTWTWSTTGNYYWEWTANLQRSVSFKGISEADRVYVNFGTNYNYSIQGDNFTNGEVAGNKDWGSYLDRKGAISPATDVTLTLDSILTFDWINPEPYSMGPPIEWRFGDVAPETGVNAGVGPGSPVSFTPGFNASRSADATHFTSAGTQTLTITVTPQQELPNLNIDVNVQEDAYVTPNIVSPTTDVTQGIWLWEGKKLHIQIPNPQIPNPVEGTPYTYEVVIEVVPKVPEIEFMPDVGIGWGENTALGNTSGASLTHAIAELGTWTWSTTGSYYWEWTENLQRSVSFKGISREIYTPVEHEPMTGQKLVGQGLFSSMPGGDTINTLFIFTNPDCIREVTINRVSIFRPDGLVAYEGPLLGAANIEAHQTSGVDLKAYFSHQETQVFYTIEIFWSESQKGLPLTGWANTVVITQIGGENTNIKSISQTPMVNMLQAAEVDKGRTK